MFRNLKAEMARSGLTTQDIANILKIHRSTISAKINGKREFTLSEMQTIQKEIFPNLTIDYLFEK